MEKDQKPIVGAMLQTSFREVMFRAISTLVLKRIYSRLESMEVKCDHRALTMEETLQIKTQYFDCIMQQDHIKKDLQRDLDEIAKLKGDMIEEVLRQHQMNIKDEQDFYHQKLGTVFDYQIWNIRLLINKGRWKELLKI